MKKLMIGALAAVMLCACGEKDTFEVKGEIEGADGTLVVVERADYSGYWQALDSTRTNGSGRFSIDVRSAGVPEIYRLRMGDAYIYFPVDSTENVKIATSVKGFGRDYTVEGSEQAKNFAEFDKEVMRLDVGNKKASEDFKRKVFSKYIRGSQGNLMSYYVLTKSVGGKLLFDPSDSEDVKYYSAVATAYKQFHPEDPRAGVLEQMALQGMKKRNKEMGKKVVVNAAELKVLDISLPGIDGKEKKLSSTIEGGKPCIVMFTSIQDKNNPALMLKLKELYGSRNICIYNVNVGGDRFAWRNSAQNLPWTSVYADMNIDGPVLQRYNVGAIPTFFIYNSSGELVDRADTYEQLKTKL